MGRHYIATATMIRAKQRCVFAEKRGHVLEGEITWEIVAPRPGVRRDELQMILSERIAERDATREALTELQTHPRSLGVNTPPVADR